MNKPIILTAANNNGNTKRFIDSFSRNVTNAELKILSFNPEIKGAFKHYDKGYPGHIKKYEYLREHIKLDRWYIYLDMFDVLFQKNIPDLDKFKTDILVSTEHHLWRQSDFYRSIIEKDDELNVLLDTPVYCSGTFAMKGNLLLNLIDFYSNVKGVLNQPYFNLWLQGKDHKNCDELFCTLHQGIDLGFINKVDDRFINSGKISSIVHGNGSYDKYL